MIKCHIDGWMHIDEAKVLWQTIQHRKNCLELGTYKGLSTWILSQANPDCKITSLDIFPENTSAAKLNCVGKNNINFLTEDSNEWLSNSTEKFDWVFVSGFIECDDDSADMIRRFISFIDISYKEKTKVKFFFKNLPISKIYSGSKLGVIWDRCESRLSEMNSFSHLD